jgi:Flp pilus assembly protein TadG
MKFSRKSPHKTRRGAIAVLAAILSIVLVGMVAFSVDLGYVLSAKEELQRSADATAMATCWEFGQKLAQGNTSTNATSLARTTAVLYASYNPVTGHAMVVDSNTSNDPGGNVVFGYISDFTNPASTLDTSNPSNYNAVRVSMAKNSSSNGEVPYFFARVFGMTGQVLQTEATAAIVRNMKGFQAPADGTNLDILPFALDINTWQKLATGDSTDNYRWNSQTNQVESGADGKVEVNLFPQGTGSPGNRGTVDIGGSNNSTNDIARQILHGISPQDLSDLGKPLQFDANGKLWLNGDTGISAGVKDELTAIMGKPRIIPVFESVSGNGNNANYTIVKWQGIRIMAVKLTGSMSQKHVTIQVAPVLIKGGVPSPASGSSDYVYSPVVLVK